MKFSYMKVLLPAATLLLTTGCMDDKYDLSDVNTLTQVKINNLTLPVKLQALEIDNLIDLEENENIKVITDAQGNKIYSIYKEGTIDSDPISIAPVHVKAEEIQSQRKECARSTSAPTVAGQTAYDVVGAKAPFTYISENIDEAIESIDYVESAKDIYFTIVINLPATLNSQKTVLKDMVLEFPKGLQNANGSSATANIGTYNATTGQVTIDSYDAGTATQIPIKVKAERVDFAHNNVAIQSDRSFNFPGEMAILPQGYIYVTPRAGASAPTKLTYDSDYDMDDFDVKNFTGNVNYKIKGVDIEPVDLSSLPEFLQDENTQIKLSNPQVYLSVVNTTAPYHTEGTTKLDLMSNFNNGSQYSAQSPTVAITSAQGVQKPCNIVLSPAGNSLTPMPEFDSDLHKYQFAGLSNILCGNSAPAGLPVNISVNLNDPRFLGHAERFPVEVPGAPKSEWEIAPVTGSYTFVAPLAFEEGSIIEYNKTDDGFSSDDMDYLYVKTMRLTATATSNVPMTMKLTAHPVHLNEDGTYTKMGVVTPIELAPGETKDIVFEIKASANDNDDVYMSGIDGLKYSAYISQDAQTAGQPLAPTETIHLENVKITVSGYYEKEL